MRRVKDARVTPAAVIGRPSNESLFSVDPNLANRNMPQLTNRYKETINRILVGYIENIMTAGAIPKEIMSAKESRVSPILLDPNFLAKYPSAPSRTAAIKIKTGINGVNTEKLKRIAVSPQRAFKTVTISAIFILLNIQN